MRALELVSKNVRLGALLIASASFGSIVTATTIAVVADQGNMVAARQSLHQAINDLNRATPDKGGHRANAISLIQQAIVEVNRGIGYANRH